MGDIIVSPAKKQASHKPKPKPRAKPHAKPRKKAKGYKNPKGK